MVEVVVVVVVVGGATILTNAYFWSSYPGSKASDQASIHCCHLGYVGIPEAFDQASLHRCHPGYVRFLEASDQASIHCCQPWLRSVCKRWWNVKNNQRECWYFKVFAGDFTSLPEDVHEEAMYGQSDIRFRLSSTYRVPKSLGQRG